MDVQLRRGSGLLPGTVGLAPGRAPEGPWTMRLGCSVAEVRTAAPAPPGELWLAADLWDRLAVPFEGLQLRLREHDSGELELGPAVCILYAGSKQLEQAEASERLRLYFGHRTGQPGLYALAFDEAIDWETGTMDGFVMDNRPGREGWPVPARFPVPAAVRLAWSIRRNVIARLRERTGERTFNWVRNIGKWQFHTLLSEVPGIREHLPETRLFRSPTDLMAMLARHDTIFVKQTFSIRGRGIARIRRLAEGFEVRHMAGGSMAEAVLPEFASLPDYVRQVLGPGRCVVQQGLPLTGLKGRALHFRVLVTRDGSGLWRCPITTASVAPDDRLVFTNNANGAADEEVLSALQEHCGMPPDQAETCVAGMESLSLDAAHLLADHFHPLGILGFDVGVEVSSGRMWLLEANSVPGFGYPEPYETNILRSQAEYALSLTGFG